LYNINPNSKGFKHERLYQKEKDKRRKTYTFQHITVNHLSFSDSIIHVVIKYYPTFDMDRMVEKSTNKENSRVDHFNRWSIVGRYMKIVRNSNDDKHWLPEIELHIPRSPCPYS
jgi:hypothetical protein